MKCPYCKHELDVYGDIRIRGTMDEQGHFYCDESFDTINSNADTCGPEDFLGICPECSKEFDLEFVDDEKEKVVLHEVNKLDALIDWKYRLYYRDEAARHKAEREAKKKQA